MTEQAKADGEGGAGSLRRVKEVEADVESRLAALRTEIEQTLGRLKTEAATAVHEARSRHQVEREVAIANARALLEADAAAILKAGEDEAKHLEAVVALDLKKVKEKLLKTVLAGLDEKSGD